MRWLLSTEKRRQLAADTFVVLQQAVALFGGTAGAGSLGSSRIDYWLIIL